jgi:hypothetical protein
LAGWIDEATSYAREALALTRRLGARGNENRALCLTADIAAASGAENADGYYREALALAEHRGMRPQVAQCHFSLGKLHRRRGDREQAQQHLHHRNGDAPRNGHELLAGSGGSGAASAGLGMAHDAVLNDIGFSASKNVSATPYLAHCRLSSAPQQSSQLS